MTDTAIKLDNVSKHFTAPGGETVAAVERMQLEIGNGEFFSFLGPSGCGKTTTLRMIAGFELPSEGEIFIQGEPMGITPPFKRPVNTVFQNYALWPHMTVFQNVAFGLEMAHMSKTEIERRVGEALEMVHLVGMDARRPRQLSGGQQQRVALARALVQQPAVLLLDEPLGALDLKLRKAMQLELKHMQKHVGITFIYVTHDQEEALTMSDHIAVMDHGRVLQVGTPLEIYEQPATRFVADFIGETNFLEGKVKAVKGGWADVQIDGDLTLRASAADDIAPGQTVTVALRPEKLGLRSAKKGAKNCLPGRVEESIYIGTDTRYIVRLSERVSVAVRVQNTAGEAVSVFSPGAEVCVEWDEESARLLTE